MPKLLKNYHHYIKATALFLAFTAGSAVFADETTTVNESLNQWHQEAGQYLTEIGNSIDGFLGDEELITSKNGTRLNVYLPTRWYENGDVNSGLNFRLKLDLPRTQNRWNLMISSFADSLAEPDGTSSLSSEAEGNDNLENLTNDTTFSAGYWLRKTANELSQLQFGLRFYDGIQPNPFMRWRRQVSENVHPTLQTSNRYNLVLDRERGLWGEAQKRFDFTVADKDLFRLQSGALYTVNDAQLQLSQVLAFYQRLNPTNLLTYYAQASVTLNDDFETVSELVAIGHNWRHRLSPKWLYLEVEPRYEWGSFGFESGLFSMLLKLEAQIYSH